eukprot:33388-Amphidinium_carterae.1
MNKYLCFLGVFYLLGCFWGSSKKISWLPIQKAKCRGLPEYRAQGGASHAGPACFISALHHESDIRRPHDGSNSEEPPFSCEPRPQTPKN